MVKMKLSKTLCVIFVMSLFAASAFAQKKADELWRRAIIAKNAKNTALAIELFRKCRDKAGDARYRSECDDQLRLLQAKSVKEVKFLTMPDTVVLPYTGEFRKVNIKSNPKKWSYKMATGSRAIKRLEKDGNDYLVIEQTRNTTLDSTISSVNVSAGDMSKTLCVIQEASPEVLYSETQELTSPAKGESYTLEVQSNYDAWTFVCDSTWLTTNRQENKLQVDIFPNNLLRERTAKILLKGRDESFIIQIRQNADEEKLTISENNLIFDVGSESRTIAVFTNAGNWNIGAAPEWASVEKIGNDSVRITVTRNNLDNIEREANIQVTTGYQTLPIHIRQMARPYVPEYVSKRILKGRNIAFGLSASYLMPIVSSTSSGSYKGSVLNYSSSDAAENADYTSTSGFTVGAIADFRLYKNLYLITGLHYTYEKYENSFSGDVERYINQTPFHVSIGDFHNSFNERYYFHQVELPVLASYRFVLSDRSNIQLNFGAFLNYGIKSKVKFSGSSNSEDVYTHWIVNNQVGRVVGNRFAIHERYSGRMDLYNNKANYNIANSAGRSSDQNCEYSAVASPFNRMNVGLQMGLIYEFAGFQAGIDYSIMLSNMANSKFWDSNRVPIYGQTGEDVMAGYRHHIHTLRFKVGYVFRYK